MRGARWAKSKRLMSNVWKTYSICLDNATRSSDMNLPGWDLHKLSGRLKGFSALQVSGNFRIWFRMENGDAFDVDYGDYH